MSDNNNDAVQHGIDDTPNDDAKKGLELGALGGGAVGASAGAALGPVGMAIGALVGGSVGSVASGATVEAVDTVDNDDTVLGVGNDVTQDDSTRSGDSYGFTGQTDPTGVGDAPTSRDSTPDVYAGTAGNISSATPNVDENTVGTSSTTPDVNLGATAAGDYESGSYVGGTDVSDTNTGTSGHNIVTGNEV